MLVRIVTRVPSSVDGLDAAQIGVILGPPDPLGGHGGACGGRRLVTLLLLLVAIVPGLADEGQEGLLGSDTNLGDLVVAVGGSD